MDSKTDFTGHQKSEHIRTFEETSFDSIVIPGVFQQVNTHFPAKSIFSNGKSIVNLLSFHRESACERFNNPRTKDQWGWVPVRLSVSYSCTVTNLTNWWNNKNNHVEFLYHQGVTPRFWCPTKKGDTP